MDLSDWSIERAWQLSNAKSVRDLRNAEPNNSVTNEAGQIELRTDELTKIRALALLGPAGIGKSYECKRLAAIEAKDGREIRCCRLAEYASTVSDLRSKLDAISAGASSTTVIYLDSIDEALMRSASAYVAVRDWIREVLRDTGASLRVVCRTSVWPAQLESALLAIDPDRATSANLQPLSTEQVRKAASSSGFEADAFLEEVASRRAESLASHPLTLQLLFGLYRRDSALPSKLRDLFSEGVDTLIEDSAERADLGTGSSSTIPLSVLRLSAERLACCCVLRGIDVVNYSGEAVQGCLSLPDLASLDQCNPPINRETLRLLGLSGLCTSDKSGRFRFAHRQFAEYLAGRHLSTLAPHQAISLLSTSTSEDMCVAGPLYETAAFAAMESDAIAEWVAAASPEVIGQSDVASEKLRQTATLSLLDRFRNHSLTKAQLSRGGLDLRGFEYAEAEDDLREVLKERGVGTEDLLACTVALIASWKMSSMSQSLAEFVLDSKAPLQTRIDACYALAAFGTEDSKLQVRDLAFKAPGDGYNQLRGLAIRCNWPANLTVPELLKALEPTRCSSFLGGYEGTLWQLDIEGFAAEGHLPAGLGWARKHVSTYGDSDAGHRLAVRIAHAAVKHLDDPDTESELLSLLVLCVEGHIPSPIEPLMRTEWLGTRSVELTSPMEEPDARRKILGTLARSDLTPETRRRIVHRTPSLRSHADFRWFLDRATDPHEGDDARRAFAEMARTLPWRNSWACAFAWWRVRKVEPITPVLDGVVAGSIPEWVRMKLTQLKYWRHTRSIDKEQRRRGPSAKRRVIKELRAAETKDVRHFRNVCRELTLEARENHYGVNSRLPTETPGWKSASQRTRSRILTIGKRYLTECNDEPQQCQSTAYNQSMNGGIAAIWLIHALDSKWLWTQSSEWWQTWSLYLLRELQPRLVGEPTEPKAAIAKALISRAPTSYRQHFCDLVVDEREGAEHLLAGLLGLFLPLPDNALDERLCELLQNRSAPAKRARDISSFILTRSPEKATEVCRQLALSTDTEDERATAAQVAAACLAQQPSQGFDLLILLAKDDEGLARSALLDYSYQDGLSKADNPPAGLSARQIGQLAGLLIRLFPPETDPVHEGTHTVSPNDTVRTLRDRLISSLGNQDNLAAVLALRELEDELGSQYAWLRHPRARAERAWRSSSWVPIRMDSLAGLLNSSSSRLLRTGEDVARAIEFAVHSYERSLHTDGPSDLEDIWNTPKGTGTSPSPKAEQHVSKKLCDVIREYIKSHGVVADREVEIFRRTGPKSLKGQSGSEVDVLVQLPGPQSQEYSPIRVPIEVKLSNNPEAKTGLKKQLAERYMVELKTDFGVFIVVWMNTNDPKALHAAHQPQWPSIAEAKGALQQQVEDLQQSPGVTVCAIVVDASL